MKTIIEKNPYITIAIVWLGIFCSHLDVLDPNIMEARNFITAREMLSDGNWLLTTMDGSPRYEKPPLPTWLAASSGYIFGLHNIQALRLPSALVTLLLLCTFYSLSSKITSNKRFSLNATLILATSFLIVFAGRNGTWDIFAHSFMLCGILYLFQFFESSSSGYKNALIAGFFIGLSSMSKGPVSHYALLLPFFISYACTYKIKNFRGKWIPLLLMLSLIFIMSTWWPYYISIYDTNDAVRIAKKESSRWINYEIKSIYYYWNFFVQSGIWTIPALISLLYPYLKSRVIDRKGYQFVLTWTLLSIVLLTFIPTKKSRYLLPVLIPLAFTTAFYIEYLFRTFSDRISKWEKLPVNFNYGLIGTIGIVFPIGAYLYFGQRLRPYYNYYILTSILLSFTGFFIWFMLLKRQFPNVFYGTIAFIFFVITAGFPLANAITGNPDYNSISKLNDSPIPVYSLHVIAPELVWDYGKKTKRISEKTLLSDDLENQFGLITYPNENRDSLNFLIKHYKFEYKETFDLNTVDTTKRGYKSRLKADYYILKKAD